MFTVMIYFRAGWFGLWFTIDFINESFEIHIENNSRSKNAEKSVVTVIAGPE